MSAVAVLPTKASVDAAWERYRVLVEAALENERLYADRAHVEAMIKAHEEFRAGFLAMEGA